MKTLAEKITLLNEITLHCLTESHENDVIEKFTEAGLEVMGADYGFVWLYKEGTEELELKYKSPDIPFTPLRPRDDGSTAEVMKKKKPLLLEAYVENTLIRDDAHSFIKSVAVVPIFFKNNIHGAIFLCYKSSHIFSEEEESLAVFVGNCVAQAITISRLLLSEHNARLNAESQEARFRTLIENSYDAILLINPEGVILDSSTSAKRVTGYEMKDLLNHNIGEFIHPDNISAMQEHIARTLQDPTSQHKIEFRYRHQEGQWRWMETVGMNMISNPSIGAIVVNIRDITERKESENIIQHQALHDPLTDLPNRQEFGVRVEQALEIAKRKHGQLALMFLDMDRFKNINDALGHSAGDTVLKVAATRFLSCLRNEDTVARFGGDEFLILINEINSPKDAALVSEKILKAMRVPIQIGEHTIHPAVSIGVAIYPADGMDLASLKKSADSALYQAKKNGRNRVQLYENSMEAYASEKIVLENELRQALLYDQIVLYYQPIISLKTREVLAVEALSRWQHPDKGLLPPSTFIPLAEEAGLISLLDEYILKKACEQSKIWQEAGLPKFRVAVNLSAQQFSEANFVSNLVSIVSGKGIEPRNLELEITESLAMSNLELTGANLKALKKLGFKISIDDFGTGYSSLSYLKRFPINNLKIDRSFIRGAITNSQDTSITRTIISMAHNLNLKAVAEGVETQQHLEFLQSLGCDAAQGFYISQPLPAEKLVSWLSEFKVKKRVFIS